MSNDPGDDRLAFYLKVYLYSCIAAMWAPIIIFAVFYFCGYDIFDSHQPSENYEEIFSRLEKIETETHPAKPSP